MAVAISSFGGIVPRLSDHSLPANAASIAHDVRLRNGRIEAWRELCPFGTVDADSVSFHVYGCCAIGWSQIVQSADVAPDWGRFFITGRTSQLETVVVKCDCSVEYFNVGVPAPVSPPGASGTESCERSSDSRAYVYTYVNQWGEESAPSPPSSLLTIADGNTVRLTGMALPPDDYGITHINVYRATTGFRQHDVKTQKPLTEFLYVGTVELPSTTFTDNVRLAALGPALETQKVRTPPSGMQNICSIEGTVRLAGTRLNMVHLSENFQPWNWPVKYDLTLDYGIVHMGCLDQKLYVTTDAIPYVIDVSSCEDTKCVPVMDVGKPLPDIACKYANAAIVTPHGYIYSSPLGLILIDPSARWTILTAKWFGEEDWAKVAPDTVRMAYWEGYLFVATDRVTFLLNINGDPFGDMHGAELCTLSDKPVALETSTTGKLFLLQDGAVQVWNSGTTWRQFQWCSRELLGGHATPGQGTIPDGTPALGSMWSPSSAKIRTQGTEFTLFTPLRTAAYQRNVATERPFRLPRMGRHLWYKAQFRGIHPVEFFDLGESNFTVNQGA